MTRLPIQPGERIDRSRPLTFTFDGEQIDAFQGDTIASALLVSGRKTFSRSFKYHRPRGELCGCGQCANSLVDVDGRPGIRACAEPVMSGMRVSHQNAWPSLDRDIMSLTGKFAGPFTPVGFYYKTFIRPRRLWPVYERLLRRAAGLGRLPEHQADREWVTEYRRRHCDLLVVGGGIAGLTAAATAAEAGLDVVLCDEDTEPGGAALAEGNRAIVQGLRSRVTAAGVEILRRAAALAFFDGLVPVWQGDTLHQIRASHHILATGTIQQPLVFGDNDLPGVMLSGGARRLAALYGVRPGRRVLVASVDDRGLADALALESHGIKVVAVADLRERGSNDALWAEAHDAGIEILENSTVARAIGRQYVTGAQVARLHSDGRTVPGTERSVDCDLIAVSGGAQPALSLLLQAGGKASYDPTRACFAVTEVPAKVHVAGALAGYEELKAAELSGEAAAMQALAELNDSTGDNQLRELRARLRELQIPPTVATPPAWTIGRRRNIKCFVDLDEDVTTKDVEQGAAEGYDSLELSKRYTTVTMGPSQGRFSQLPAARALARATGLSLEAVGLTTARPPWLTVPLGALAGRPFEPVKRSSLHARHHALGANIRWAGDWRRPYDYGDPQAEAMAVQRSAGLIDVSTLGKLLVQGDDAGELLDRMYPNRMSDLKPGRVRYGALLSEAGRIVDDGTVCRIDDDTFYVTTTSAGAASVEQQLSWWQTTWALDAHVTDLTQGIGAMNLAGPRAREVLAGLTDLDCSAESFKYMDARHGIVAGVPALILRIGFVGEVGYEIHCPAPQAPHLWEALLACDSSGDAESRNGASGRVTPFGLEPQRILRLQKLHLIVGQDTDSESTPFNSGMDWVVKLDKPQAFIGRWALEHTQDASPATQLVGFTIPSGEVVAEGAVVLNHGASTGCQVTSSRWSPHLGASIGMATVPTELAVDGQQVEISYAGKIHTALIKRAPFYDPEGEVLRS